MKNVKDCINIEKDIPAIKDDHGYIVNPYIPKFISQKPWYISENKNSRNNNILSKDPFNKRTFDEIHDRWNNYDNKDWTPSGKETIQVNKEKDKEFSTYDPYSRTCSRNLRIREDMAKYLDKSISNSDMYNPKSRSFLLSDKIEVSSNTNTFAWEDSGRKINLPKIHFQSEASSGANTSAKNDRRLRY